MDKLPSLCLVFVASLGLTSGAGLLPDGPVYKAVGETVKFNTDLTPPETPFGSINWFFEEKLVFGFGAVNNTGEGYEGRITLFISTGSLELRDLTLNDTGEYSVTIVDAPTVHTGSTTLNVLERVTGVEVTANSTDLVEGSSVSLSCSVSSGSSGSSLSFLWTNQSSVLTDSDRVQLSDGNSTVIINPVNRYDQGPFRCHVSNPVSDAVSDPFNLPPVSYGPENTNLSVDPLKEHYAAGSNISLFCSADSRPDAQFTWFLNGDQQIGSGSELKLTNIEEGQSGDYTCQSFNAKTLRKDTSMFSVSVLERVSGVSLTPSTDQMIEGNSVNLTCDAAAGSMLNRTWMKDGTGLTLADHITFHEEKKVLSFQGLRNTDKGEYSCNINNPVSSMEAKYNLVVNFGPENVTIKGSDKVQIGETITLTCSADSVPLANFTWSVNGTEIHNAAVFIKEKANVSDSGTYTCTAKNDVTGKSLPSVVELTVTATDPNPPAPTGCSGGCIAGIVIACLVVVGAAAGVGYYFYRKKKSKGISSSSRAGGGRGQDNSASTGNKELNYADITAFHRRDGGAVELRTQNETSEYAQVRGNNNNNASNLPSYSAHMQRAKRQAPQPAVDETQPYAQVRKN